MSQNTEEIDAKLIVDIQRRKLDELGWQNTVLQAQLQELGARLQEAAGDKMEIRRLQLLIEELQTAVTQQKEQTPT